MKKIKIENEDRILKMVKKDPNIIKYLDIDSESIIVESLLMYSPELIRYIEKPSISHLYTLALNGESELALERATTDREIGAILSVDPEAIKYIDNPSEKLQMSVIQNCNAYKCIKNPSEKVTRKFLRLHSEGIKYIDNPSEELKTYAVKYKPEAIKYIKNPSMKLMKMVVKSNPVNIRLISENLDVDKYIKLINKEVVPYVNRYDEKIIEFLMDNYPDASKNILINYYDNDKDTLRIIKKSIEETGIDYYMRDPFYLNGSDLDFEDINDFIKEDIRLLTTLEHLSKENQKLIYDKYGVNILTKISNPCIDVIIKGLNDGFTKLETLDSFSPSELLIENHHRLSEEMIEIIITNRKLYIDDIIFEFLPDYKVVKKEMIRRNLKINK